MSITNKGNAFDGAIVERINRTDDVASTAGITRKNQRGLGVKLTGNTIAQFQQRRANNRELCRGRQEENIKVCDQLTVQQEGKPARGLPVTK